MIEYQRAGLTFDNLSRLEHAGLIRLTGGGETFGKVCLQKQFVVSYFADRFSIEFNSGIQEPTQQAPVYRLRTGQVSFTQAGAELSSLSGARSQDGFIRCIAEYWKRFGVKFEPMSSMVPQDKS